MTTERIECDTKHGEGLFLINFFNLLDQEQIRYAVMRNFDPLPYSAGGSDLDLLIAPEHEQKARSVLFKAITISNAEPIGVAESVGFFKVYILGKNPAQRSQWWGIRIDMNIGIYFQGYTLIDVDIIDFSAEHHNGIAVLPDSLASTLGVLKEVLNNNKFASNYASGARRAIKTDWPRVSALLSPMGDHALNQLYELLTANDLPDDINQYCATMRKNILRHSLQQDPINYIAGRIRFTWSRARRLITPSGIVIAILGVDGAGKSTIINAILPALEEATHNAVWIQHLRPGLLPPLARMKGSSSVKNGPTLDPHGSRPSGKFVSAIRISYLLLDYLFGYWIRIRPKIAKQPTVVVFDRYAYDIALDPRRFRINLPGKMTAWFTKLAPKPDLIICLTGNPEIIAARKQELSVDETRRQIDALVDFAHQNIRAALITTDNSIEESRDQTLQAILTYLSQKTSCIVTND